MRNEKIDAQSPKRLEFATPNPIHNKNKHYANALAVERPYVCMYVSRSCYVMYWVIRYRREEKCQWFLDLESVSLVPNGQPRSSLVQGPAVDATPRCERNFHATPPTGRAAASRLSLAIVVVGR